MFYNSHIYHRCGETRNPRNVFLPLFATPFLCPLTHTLIQSTHDAQFLANDPFFPTLGGVAVFINVFEDSFWRASQPASHH